MDISKYELFAITAETGNISRTAQQTGYTQSGVSHMLKRLEKDVGMELFVRDRYGVHLTAMGNEFLKYVRSILSETEKLKQFVYDANGMEVGTLTIGTYSTIATHWLPKILGEFQKDHPMIKIRLREGGMQELCNYVTHKDVDLAFISKQQDMAFEFLHLQMDPLLAILPPSFSPEGIQTACPLETFANTCCILPEEDFDTDIYTLFRNHNVTPKIRFNARDNHAIINMVANDLGLAIVPKLALDHCNTNVTALPLNPGFERDLGIGYLDETKLSPIAKKFVWFVESYFL